jgi:hypothetical protein
MSSRGVELLRRSETLRASALPQPISRVFDRQWPVNLAQDLQVTHPGPSGTGSIGFPCHSRGFGPHRGSPSSRIS